MEGVGQASCGAEAVVRTVDVGEAVRHEDRGKNDKPALAHLGLNAGGVLKRCIGRVLHDGFHDAMFMVAVRGCCDAGRGSRTAVRSCCDEAYTKANALVILFCCRIKGRGESL